jgi:hypothetical protein
MIGRETRISDGDLRKKRKMQLKEESMSSDEA